MLHFCQLSDQSLLGLLHHRRNSNSNLQDHLRDLAKFSSVSDRERFWSREQRGPTTARARGVDPRFWAPSLSGMLTRKDASDVVQ